MFTLNVAAMDIAKIRKRVLSLLRDPKTRPLTKSGLARALEIPPDARAAFRRQLKLWEDEGLLIEGKKGTYRLREHTPGGLTGTLKFLNTGGAHFTPDRQDPDNRTALLRLELDPDQPITIYVPAHETATALPGDQVLLKAYRARGQREGFEGRVLKVLKRSSRTFVGTLKRRGSGWCLEPDDPAIPVTFDVKAGKSFKASPGHKVVAQLEAWEHESRRPLARIVKPLGPPDTPGVAVLAIIHKYDLPTEFPREVLQEAESFPSAPPAEEIELREDWRDRAVITIDPDDARDFDDAISVEPLPGGGWELAVHIADVSYYVKPGSALDREAKHRGNSVYLADRVLPMLPEALSNGLCSLQPGVDRLTRVVVLRFDAKGRRTHMRFARAVIRSQRRFTYEEAYALLKAADARQRHPVLDRAWPLASLLRRRRFANGSLDLDFPEVRAVLDAQGRPIGLRTIPHDESHQLIEEFMLAANEAVAHFLKHAGAPTLYRVHEDPDPEKLATFALELAAAGLIPGDLTQRTNLQRVLARLRGRADEHALKLSLLKSLKRALYTPEPRGHFGLAKNDYTHFTSPIRRYADLVVHRALGAVLAKRGAPAETFERAPSSKHMVDLGEHLSTTERVAAEAEQESQRLMQALYFASLLRKKNPPVFPAVITEVQRRGVFVELREYPVRGLVKTEDFPEGHFYYDPAANRHYSRSPRYAFRTGTEVRVTVSAVDIDRRQIDFRILPEERASSASRRRSTIESAFSPRRHRS